ncbi:MAG TPA: phosphate transport system regulatory protein PhoU, partial [Rhodobacteraceae bacterium]|nr:phosphate transport system regulatory protein PhoU [Paracoccaceae bacterium]
TSICEQVVFLATGELPRDPRPKSDFTSQDLDISLNN